MESTLICTAGMRAEGDATSRLNGQALKLREGNTVLATDVLQVADGVATEIFNDDHGIGRKCTDLHEQTHINDYKKRYGENSCMGKDCDGNPMPLPRGTTPRYSIGNDDLRDFMRDSECRAYTAKK